MEIIIALVVAAAIAYFVFRPKAEETVSVVESAPTPSFPAEETKEEVKAETPAKAKKSAVKKATTRKPKTATKKAPAKKPAKAKASK